MCGQYPPQRRVRALARPPAASDPARPVPQEATSQRRQRTAGSACVPRASLPPSPSLPSLSPFHSLPAPPSPPLPPTPPPAFARTDALTCSATAHMSSTEIATPSSTQSIRNTPARGVHAARMSIENAALSALSLPLSCAPPAAAGGVVGSAGTARGCKTTTTAAETTNAPRDRPAHRCCLRPIDTWGGARCVRCAAAGRGHGGPLRV